MTTPEAPDPTLEALAATVKARREELGLSIEQVAERSGLPYDTVWSVESGRRFPSLAVLRQMAAALETTDTTLLR